MRRLAYRFLRYWLGLGLGVWILTDDGVMAAFALLWVGLPLAFALCVFEWSFKESNPKTNRHGMSTDSNEFGE